MILETERLYLREMTESDYVDLCEILQDKTTMYAYEHAFSDEESRSWLERQFARYAEFGFGLWAAIRKDTGEFVGQVGITMQDCGGESVPEIGWLLKRRFWHCGYATEAAFGCMEYGFRVLGMEKLYGIIRDNNLSSQRVARRIGMEQVGGIVKHYYGMDMPHCVFSRTRQDYLQERGE